jgi:hypothetical protein
MDALILSREHGSGVVPGRQAPTHGCQMQRSPEGSPGLRIRQAYNEPAWAPAALLPVQLGQVGSALDLLERV